MANFSGKMRLSALTAGLAWLLASSALASEPPKIETLLKPAIYKRLVEDKESAVHASLDDVSGSETLKKYTFYAAMLAGASVTQTRHVLLDYPLLAKMVPYVKRSEYNSATRTLTIEGGIWNFVMRSLVQFEERGDRWLHFRIVGGHFTGLSGEIYFESAGEKGTLVYFSGAQEGTKWPPKFILERGAEIVFGFTARRMRSYLESLKHQDEPKGESHDGQIPRPRSHL